MHKNIIKTFLQHIAVGLCKKRPQKTANIRKMRAFWKYPKMATKQKRHFGSKNKIHKNMLKRFLQHIAVVVFKNGSKKQLKIEKWEHFENIQKSPPSKGYRLFKIVTLGQKLNMHKNMLKTFLQHIALVLCKKRLQKTVKIPKMRAFWKMPKMATKERP